MPIFVDSGETAVEMPSSQASGARVERDLVALAERG